MWYFIWILGLGLAVVFGIVNGLWHEYHAQVEDEPLEP